MKDVSGRVLGILIILLCATLVVAVGDQPRPDGWAGMVLDASTPDDAIHRFGTPTKDKGKIALDLPRPLSWLSDRYKEKIFRTLTYKKLPPFKQVHFSFFQDKLVAIIMEAPNAELEDDWLDPDDLPQLFGTAFKPHKRQHNRKLPAPLDFVTNAPAELNKDDYAYWYDMIAVSEKSFIVAIADNYQYNSGLFDSPDVKRRKKINARGAKYPGYVSNIEVLSRSLANL